jgi:hypothetical protein
MEKSHHVADIDAPGANMVVEQLLQPMHAAVLWTAASNQLLMAGSQCSA